MPEDERPPVRFTKRDDKLADMIFRLVRRPDGGGRKETSLAYARTPKDLYGIRGVSLEERRDFARGVIEELKGKREDPEVLSHNSEHLETLLNRTLRIPSEVNLSDLP